MAAGQSREIKGRLQSIRNTKKITKAMELVAAAKMRRAVAGVLATRTYATHMWDIMQRLRTTVTVRSSDSAYRFLQPVTTETKKLKTAIVLFTSNRGLCGSFNSHMVKVIANYVKDHPEETITVLGVGKKGVGLLSSLGITVQEAYVKDDTAKTSASIIAINQAMYEQFQRGDFDQVLLGYTDYRSIVAQTPTLKTLFPYAQTADISETVENLIDEKKTDIVHAPAERQYIYEPHRYVILNYLIPRIAEVQLYQALLESNASEHSSRMLAMKNATDAAKDMADALLLAFNRARQAGITQEIAEISAGSAAVT